MTQVPMGADLLARMARELEQVTLVKVEAPPTPSKISALEADGWRRPDALRRVEWQLPPRGAGARRGRLDARLRHDRRLRARSGTPTPHGDLPTRARRLHARAAADPLRAPARHGRRGHEAEPLRRRASSRRLAPGIRPARSTPPTSPKSARCARASTCSPSAGPRHARDGCGLDARSVGRSGAGAGRAGRLRPRSRRRRPSPTSAWPGSACWRSRSSGGWPRRCRSPSRRSRCSALGVGLGALSLVNAAFAHSSSWVLWFVIGSFGLATAARGDRRQPPLRARLSRRTLSRAAARTAS